MLLPDIEQRFFYYWVEVVFELQPNVTKSQMLVRYMLSFFARRRLVCHLFSAGYHALAKKIWFAWMVKLFGKVLSLAPFIFLSGAFSHNVWVQIVLCMQM